MKGFLLDTNVPSELTKPNPQSSVSEWLEAADYSKLYFSVISLGEIMNGITALPASKRRTDLQFWLDGTLRPWFAGRVLPVTEQIAERWGQMAATRQMRGMPLKVADGLIAATALEHDLVLVTRNEKDFIGLGVEVFNPWI